jgi:hypothetical protein
MPRSLDVQLADEVGLSSRQVAAARRSEASQALEVHRYSLGARARAEIDMIDSQAVADASRTALDEEVGLLEYGLARAGGSAAKTELVARHVERMAAINDRRITRRFGG